MILDCCAVKVIENEPFGANGGPLDHHPCPARDEEQEDMRASKVTWKVKPAILNLEDLPGFGCQKVFRFAGSQEPGDQLLASADAGEGHRVRSRGHRRYYNSHCTCRLRYGDIRPTKRPSASECHVHAQTESPRFIRRK